MTEASRPEEPQDPAATHEAARLRGPRRLLAWGAVAGIVLAVMSGLAGLDGRAGFALFLLLLALVTGASGVWIAGALLLDEFRGDPTSLRRGLWVVGLFAATFVCMTAVGGVAGGTS